MPTNPKVSVALITYNQQDCVGRTIESILNQTYQNFEIIVGDDSSTDETARVVKSYKDERIKYFKTDYNIGINGNLNLAVNKANGDIIAFTDGDDKLRENYLEHIVGCFESMSEVDVVYSQLCAIDKNDKYIKGKDEYFWRTFNKTRQEYIYQAFMDSNILQSPGMAMRKRVVESIFPLPCSLANFQDYAMHIDILINGFKCYVLDKILVDYRIFDDGRNMSLNNDTATKREQMEISALMNYFLKIKDIKLLQEIFKDEIANTSIQPYDDTIPFFLGQMALLSSDYERKEWGYHTIMKFLSNKSNFDIAHSRYGFEFKDYLKLIEKISLSTSRYFKKYKKYKIYTKIALVVLLAQLALIILSLNI